MHTYLQSNALRIATCATISLFLFNARAHADPTTRPAWEMPLRYALVKGIAISTTKPSPEIMEDEVTFKAQHIFCGKGVSVDGEFTAVCFERDTRGTSPFPAPEVGEVGLWVVLTFKDVKPWTENTLDRVFFDDRFAPLIFEFPQRQGVTARYVECEKLAEAIEAAAKADEKGRSELLWKDLNSEVAEIAAWAACALFDADPAGLKKLGTDTAALKQIPLAGQLGVDIGLSMLDANWRDGPEHKAIVARCIAASDKEVGSLPAIMPLYQVRKYLGLQDGIGAVDFLKRVALSDSAWPELRRDAVGYIEDLRGTDITSAQAAAARKALEEIARKGRD